MSLPLDFVNELRKHFSGEIRDDLGSRILYSTDASMYQLEPLGVVLPRTQENLIAAVELAAKYKIPILPRGSGTSLAGQAIGMRRNERLAKRHGLTWALCSRWGARARPPG